MCVCILLFIFFFSMLFPRYRRERERFAINLSAISRIDVIALSGGVTINVLG